jgi:ATP-binding cassette, subfamily B, bacterial
MASGNNSHKDKGVKANGKPSVFGLLKPYSGLVFLLVVFALAGNGINLVIPMIISRAIDGYGHGGLILSTVVIQLLLASIFILLFNYLQGVAQTYTSEKAARDLRKQVSEKISQQSYAYILQANPSRLLTNLTSDVDSIKMFIAHAVSSIISSLFVIIGASVLLITINWKLALAVLIIIPLIGGAFYLMLRKVRVLFRKSREVIDWLNRVINESILGSTLIRILNSQQQEYQKFLSINATSRDIGLSILTLFAALIPFITFVSNMAILTVLVLGGHFVITGTMTLGNFAAFNGYIAILIFPILVIGFMSNIIAHATASYQRVQQVLDAPATPDQGDYTGNLTGDIEIKDVTVNYGQKPVLKGIDIHISSGSKVAIIGPTAAGKTQLLYLLTGLIRPDSGEVLFDGHPIDSYRKDCFYSQVGLVFQDSIIFNISMRENIAFSEEVSDDMLHKAIETAELKGFIDTLPQKLDTLISERGTSLSGGQKQRIMLARALALNPRILLLDDFTARIDKKTEQKIMENIQANYPEMTILTITQKIAPVEHYEQVILLMESEIIASGTHETLIHTCPEYVQIYNSQRSTSHYDLQS